MNLNQQKPQGESGITLGSYYRDQITGFEGVAISKTQYLFGCERVMIQPTELKEGKPIDAYVFDCYSLKQVTAFPTIKPVGVAGDPGGPGEVPAPRAVPKR